MMIEVGLGRRRLGRRNCASLIVCGGLRVRLAARRCTTRGPAGLQRDRARQTLRTPMCGARVCTAPHVYMCLVDFEGPGLSRRLAGRQRRRAPNVTHADGWETCVRQTIRFPIVSCSAPCTRHARETSEIIPREQRATPRHARDSKSLKSSEEISSSGGPAPG